ncbi:FMN reductase [Pengzhenrongella frigida]|uniref:NADPH-dependent FMN reductase n=1 Tax=Pengzhenrongella frigida TaxID=1259133 RepID=A0A4Q5N726_9MICO|nr:FMN reductase [Cellulomonas sp. HLT2-17]RYV52857.1 NADPH-dependent FMN reductase [Cellulomonas sp. HLT2-17]
MSDRTIAVISAGLSQPSSTRMLADRLAEATVAELGARGLSATVKTFELRDVAHELINNLLTGFPSGDLRGLLTAVTGADGLIAVTPVFTTSYSGLFKTFVDILDKDSLEGMPVLLGATGGTPRHSLALEYSMRPLFTYLHADVARTSVFAATDDWSGPADAPADRGSRAASTDRNALHSRILRAGRELAEMAAAQPHAAPADPYADAPSFTDLLGHP